MTEVAHRRLDYVQGLRAVAILLVVLFHAAVPLHGGYLGVDVFFVISGFVITGVLLEDLRGRGLSGLGNFYLRRVRRLLPALAVLLVAVVCISAVLESPFTRQPTTGHVGIYASFFLANDALYNIPGGYFADSAAGQLLLHTWSLSVEEQFYFLFPVLLLIAFRFRLRRRPWVTPAVVIGLVTAVSLTIFLLLTVAHLRLPFAHDPGSAAFYLPFGRAWEFGVGALVAFWYARGGSHDRRLALVLGPIAAVVLLVSAAVLRQSSATSPTPLLAIPVIATALLISTVGIGSTPLGRLLSAKPMVWIGDCSYSWYLWHWPLIVVARGHWPGNRWALLAAAAISLVVGRLSYLHVEQRFRRARRRYGQTHPVRAAVAIGAVCILVPAAAMAGLRTAAEHDWGSDQIKAMLAQVIPTPPETSGVCASARAIRADAFAACTWGAGRPGAPIYLFGDSNAGQYADGVIAAGKQLDRPVIIAWKSRCSLLDLAVHLPVHNEASCRAYNAAVQDYLKTHPSGTVVTASLNAYIEPRTLAFSDPTTGQRSSDPAVKQRMWADALTRSLGEVRAAGHPVVYVGVIPHPRGEGSTFGPRWDPRNCSLYTLIRSIANCGVTVSLASEDHRQARSLAAEDDAMRSTGVTYLDLRPVVCPDGTCATNHGNDWIYRDGHHLTNRYSTTLSSRLAQAIAGADG